MSETREMTALFAQARATGKWFWTRYQDLWFSPDQLERERVEGRFRWRAENWTLRDPRERLQEANAKLEAALAKRDRVAREIGAA